MTTLGRYPILSASLVAAVLALAGAALAATRYPDRRGDVTGGAGPDLLDVRLSNTATTVAFHLRFAMAPPLRVDPGGKWVDMLLIAVDVPPLGPSPVMPGGEWPGVNFALGTHGPARTGTLVRLEPGAGNQAGSTPVARFAIHTSGATLTFTVPRRALGSPRWFVFSVAAARESANRGNGGGLDLVPGRGTLRYVLRG